MMHAIVTEIPGGFECLQQISVVFEMKGLFVDITPEV